MARWFVTGYKGYQICQWEDSGKYFVTRHGDVNNPLKTGLVSSESCKEFIDSITT